MLNAIGRSAAHVFGFFRSIATGMGITWHYLVRPGEVVTMQYPDEKWEVPPRFRGFHTVAFEGKEACIGCLMCEKICPEHAIAIKTTLGEDKKRRVDDFRVDLGICSFCGNCQEICPAKAIQMGAEYEGSVYNRAALVRGMERLRRAPIPKDPPAALPGPSVAAPAGSDGAPGMRRPQDPGSDRA